MIGPGEHIKPGGSAAMDSAARMVEGAAEPMSRLEIFHGYIAVFGAAFIVTLLATPLLRRLAIANGVVDRPSQARKIHRVPVAYLGGVAVYLGILAGILLSYAGAYTGLLVTFHPTTHFSGGMAFDNDPQIVPISVLLGITIIMGVGLFDDVVAFAPRLKVAGQLMAAAALAYSNVGVKVAAGAILPIAKGLGIPITNLGGFDTIYFTIPLPEVLGFLGTGIPVDVVYWIGTAVIAVFVLGACNAANLIDGLDGLLSGVTTIAAAGLLIISLTLAATDDGPRDAQRIILCLALMGACMGFLPHNFNPATIFLGDAGSLMLGFTTIVIVLMLGDTGNTHLVLAGLIIFGIPIIDTVLAIVRRKMAGKKMSDPDDQHLHHMLKRALGVKGAVFTLYGIGLGFAALGVALSLSRARVVYALALIVAAYIWVTAIKIARRKQMEEQMAKAEAGLLPTVPGPAEPPAAEPPTMPGTQTP
jgi:UDP-GlcNAc:undecaprenyl-phosphate/decaprenyl-phosphate GlcNAc-1-phosphate transferase